MSFVPYKPSSSAWNNIQGQVHGKRFYPLQQGSGSSIQIVSPAQGSVQRAKSELKRQMSRAPSQSSPSKKGRNTTPSVKAKQKKPATKKKTTLKKKKKKTPTKKKTTGPRKKKNK